MEEEPNEPEDSGSGEDSDEAPDKAAQEERRKHDMDMLLREQSRSLRAPAARKAEAGAEGAARAGGSAFEADSATPAGGAGYTTEEPTGEVEAPLSDEGSQASSPVSGGRGGSPTGGEAAAAAQGASPGKRRSLMSRLLFRSSAAAEPPALVERGTSLLDQDTSDLSEEWFQKWAARFGAGGLKCTKVATNGRPYERRVHIDARNFSLEVREGRTGATGVLLDDLVNVWQGLCSPEFAKFCQRFKSQVITGQLSTSALVLQTPMRTFSFLFASESQRDTIGRFIVYLLKTKKRGVMSRGSTTGAGGKQAKEGFATKPPKEGFGKVTYPNCSTYEGEFRGFMRHGQGTLTLSEGTRYECEWRNDERHGQGRESWADGTLFVGSYQKGMRSGHGVMTWPEGSRYSGHFECGRANGEGELVRTDGSVYRGAFSEDCMSGEGRMQWRDGVVYTGHFSANRREGFGKMVWTSGKWKSYEGHWKDGMQHGHGTLVDQSNVAFSGTFHEGKLERWDDGQ